MALFRWSATHPISNPLSALLEEAGGCRCPARQPADLHVFLPPHLLLEAGVEATDLTHAYDGPAGGPSASWLVNGERLLGLGPTAIAHWLQRQPPAEPMPLAAMPPLLAVVTLAQLEQAPGAAQRYEQLEEHSERGGAAADIPYRARLRPSAAELLADWQLTVPVNQQNNKFPPADAGRLQGLASDLELQIAQTLQAKDKARALEHQQRQLLIQLQRQRQTLLQLMALQSRICIGQSPTFSR
jgi:hypothetical protein